MTPLEHVLNLLHGRGSKTKQLTPTQWEAQCPAHEDHTSSLSLSEGADRQALLYCHAGCTLETIIGALNLKPADLFLKKSYDDQILTVYDYHNPEGDIIFQVVKKAGKQFRQRRPDSKGGWIWDLDGVTRVPYQLPDLISAVKDQRAIFIPEGEKDADKLRTFGLTATTNPGGAGKWRPEYAQWFKGANRIFILPDNDQPGQSHAQEIARNLTPHVNSLKIINLPNLPAKGDITDWFDNGGTLDQLRQLVKTINPYTPTEGATDLGQLIQEVYDWYGRFVSYPTQHDQLAHTLWTIHTHIMDSWNSTPRIAFLSPEPASGKTRALEVTEPLVPNPVNAVNVTPAYLFRKVGEDGPLPTILYDEIDTVFGPKAKENEEIRGLINAGHRRNAVAGRCVVIGRNVKTEEIPAYCAVALAGLGEIPDTILTRSIVIRMQRRAPGEQIEPFRGRINTPQGEQIRNRLATATSQIRTLLADAWPEMPEGVEDRDADKWEPLLAIADAAGGHWPAQTRHTVQTLVTLSKASTPSLGIRLLEDLRTIFGEQETLTTEMILKALTELEEAPWGDLFGKPLNARGLAQRLAKYGIPKSRTVRVGEIIARGHARIDFQDVWTRYLTESVMDVTDVTHSKGGDSSDLGEDPPSSENPITYDSPPPYENVTSVTNVTNDPKTNETKGLETSGNVTSSVTCPDCHFPIPGAHHHYCPTIPTTPTDTLNLPDPW